MKIIECEQNSPEWFAARLGRFTASNMDMIISPTGKQSKSAEKYVTKLLGEIVTGRNDPTFTNSHMERGKELEQEAADYYAMLNGVELRKVGFCITDDGLMGCSPDRLVGDDGVLEIKTCISSVMIEAYENDSLEQDHRPQTQSNVHILGRKWVETMLYCPGAKPIIRRSAPLTPYIMDMLTFTRQAQMSLKNRLAALKEKGLIDEDVSRIFGAG